MSNILPVITLYQPWATWIVRGWKTIETRTHNRFASLAGKTILIHAGMKTDQSHYAVYNPYLTMGQFHENTDEMVNGFILGSAFVDVSGVCRSGDSKRALIECDTMRYGLFLSNVKKFDKPIPVKGEMGVWYFDMDKMEKCKKAEVKTNQLNLL